MSTSLIRSIVFPLNSLSHRLISKIYLQLRLHSLALLLASSPRLALSCPQCSGVYSGICSSCWTSLFCVLISGCSRSLLLCEGLLPFPGQGLPSLQCGGFPLLWSTDSRRVGLSSCSRAQAPQSCCTGLVALRHVGSSWTKDGTCVSCPGGWILYR